MRVVLMSLLIPLVVGCGGDAEDEGASSSDCNNVCKGQDSFYGRCAPYGTIEHRVDRHQYTVRECFVDCIQDWEYAHEEDCTAEYQTFLNCWSAIDFDAEECVEGQYSPLVEHCGTNLEAFEACGSWGGGDTAS